MRYCAALPVIVCLFLTGCPGPCTPGILAFFPQPKNGKTSGATGISAEDPVVITGIHKEKDIRWTETQWIYSKTNWASGELSIISTLKNDGKTVECIQWLKLPQSGQPKPIPQIYYFDITDAQK